MDSQNIHGIILQLKSITESIDKIAGDFNNPWTIWISLAGILVALLLGVIGIFQEKIRTWILKPKLKVVIENYKFINANLSRKQKHPIKAYDQQEQ